MTDTTTTTTIAGRGSQAHRGTPAHRGAQQAPAVTSARPGRLPKAGWLLIAQIGYQVRLLLSNGRALAVGIGLPVILLVATKGTGSHSHPNVAGYAVFGLTITAWSTYGVRLVAAREGGVLKRWRATPLPRWCYFAGTITATAITAIIAAAVTILAALALWGPHFDDGPGTDLTRASALPIVVAFVLGSLAWAATATAFTALIPTAEAAFPLLILTFFPVVIVSGVLFSISEPSWLSTAATYLPAQPLIDAITGAVQHTHGALFMPYRDLTVLACWAVGGLTAAIVAFRWEPHRPTKRRSARATR